MTSALLGAYSASLYKWYCVFRENNLNNLLAKSTRMNTYEYNARLPGGEAFPARWRTDLGIASLARVFSVSYV